MQESLLLLSLSVFFGFCHVRTNKPGSRLSPHTRSAGALILYFLVSRTVRCKCLWLKPPNRWCSVTAAQTATVITIQVDGMNGPPSCLHTLYHVVLPGPLVCVEHTPLPCDVGFHHGFALASRMRQKWRCSSPKPHLQQVWVLPLVSGLCHHHQKNAPRLASGLEEVRGLWSRTIPANSPCISHPGQTQMWGWWRPSPFWVNWLSCNSQVTHGSVRWKVVYLSLWGLGCFCYTAHQAIAVWYKI